MVVKETEHDTLVYCDNCFKSFGRYITEKKCCNNPDRQFAFREVDDKTNDKHIQLVTQCVSCGNADGNSISQKGKDLSEVKFIDYDLEFAQSTLRNLRFFEVEEEFREKCFEYNEARPELLDEGVKFENYDVYRKSRKWKDKTGKVLKRDNHTCKSCGEAPAQAVHHITYDNIYDEPLFELVSVCNSCHFKIHKRNKYQYREEQNRLYRNLLS